VKTRESAREPEDHHDVHGSDLSGCSDSAIERGGEVRYANTFEVGFNAFEFLFDLGQVFGTEGICAARTRIVTSPVFARDFLGVLTKSVAQYEAQFGRIEEHCKTGAKSASSEESVVRPLGATERRPP
jgi:uncharacterized protein DUF3467